LKHTATLEDTRHSFDEMASSLQNHFQKINPEEPENVKLATDGLMTLGRAEEGI
jgi:hypothetical protein